MKPTKRATTHEPGITASHWSLSPISVVPGMFLASDLVCCIPLSGPRVVLFILNKESLLPELALNGNEL